MDINKIVHKISLLHSTSTETPTDFELAKQIVDTLTVDWTNSDLKILDPACGRGTILLAVFNKLLESGHTPNHIVNSMLYGIDTNSVQTRIATKALCLASGVTPNVYIDNSLTRDWNMKFDVVVGNPPFQESKEDGSRKSMSTNLWTKFIDMSVNDLLADDGHLVMITPASWAGPTKNLAGDRRVLKDIFAKNNTYYINLTKALNNYFAGVGSTFSYFALSKGAYNGTTLIQLDDSTINVDLTKVDSLPRVNNQLAYSINDKYMSKINGEVIKGQLQSASIIQYQETKDTTFSWPAYHTPAKGGRIWYTNNKHPDFDSNKIIISLSGVYQPLKDQGTQGFTDMCLAYIIKPSETLDSAYSVINSKMFHFVMECNKWSGFNNKQMIRNFALPKLDKVYTDDEIFDYFDLTVEEKDFINNHIPSDDIDPE
jgi:hypothetical protein